LREEQLFAYCRPLQTNGKKTMKRNWTAHVTRKEKELKGKGGLPKKKKKNKETERTDKHKPKSDHQGGKRKPGIIRGQKRKTAQREL